MLAFFPEFPDLARDPKGQGDFAVDFAATKADFERITPQVHPLALISFGQGNGPWEVEWRFPDFWQIGEGTYFSTLPVDEIAAAVNASGKIRAWVDREGDPGNFLCGYMSYLGGSYRAKKASRSSPTQMISQGFIHVGTGLELPVYKEALYATLKALARHLDSERAKLISIYKIR